MIYYSIKKTEKIVTHRLFCLPSLDPSMTLTPPAVVVAVLLPYAAFASAQTASAAANVLVAQVNSANSGTIRCQLRLKRI